LDPLQKCPIKELLELSGTDRLVARLMLEAD
jgi:hypothetical protein